MSPVIVTLIIFEFLLFLFGEALYCYNCASNLPSNISKDAQRAFKTVLYSTFMVPPVDKSCINSEDVAFRTVKQIDCLPDDQCVKITVRQKNLQFVMRGCQKFIFRDKVIDNKMICHHVHSPSICHCSGNLCNSALIFSSYNYICSLIFFIILLSSV
ncbi:putative integral membrane protein [Brugia pahangi]